jgi:hypothetical protein
MRYRLLEISINDLRDGSRPSISDIKTANHEHVILAVPSSLLPSAYIVFRDDHQCDKASWLLPTHGSTEPLERFAVLDLLEERDCPADVGQYRDNAAEYDKTYQKFRNQVSPRFSLLFF